MAGALKSLARTAVRALDAAVPARRGVTILAYHRAGGHTPVSVDIPVPLLAEQLDWLAAHTRVVDLDTAATELLPQPDTPPVRPAVVLTADDGTTDWVEHLLPLLVERSLPMTWYVATAFVEAQRPFPNDGRPVSWEGLAEAVSTGLVTVGSHTHDHLVMTHVGGDEASADLDRSIGLIEDRLSVACRHFAYPKARPGSPEADREVRRRFVTAALAGNRVNVPGRSDPARLGRTPVQRTDMVTDLARLATGHGRLQGAARDTVDRLRHRNSIS